MNHLGSQLWQGKARYFLASAGRFIHPWAPYAQLDFAVSSARSLPNEAFEKRAVRVFTELAREGHPFLLVMLDEAMRSIWRDRERDELLRMATAVMNSVPAQTTFAAAEYALVRHILHTEASGVEVETSDLNDAASAHNPFAAATQALLLIREDFDHSFEATLHSARLGNCFAAHEYAVQHHRRKFAPGSGAADRLRELLMELARQDDCVALLDLALLSRADQDALILSAAAGNWQALWNIEKDESFGLADDLGHVCRSFEAQQIELRRASAYWMQAALLSCWNRLGAGT